MLGLLFLLFTVVPALELYLLLEIGDAIGGFNTILLIIFTGIVGAALAKSQGLSILAKIQNQMNTGELPADQIIQGLMVFAGGLLLITPGIMTDVFGFSLVLPGTRHILMVFVKNALERAIKNGNVQFSTFGASSGSGRAGGFHYTSHHADFSDEPKQEKPIQPGVIEAEYTRRE